MFSGCSKQAMYIKVLPLLFTAATPQPHPEEPAQTVFAIITANPTEENAVRHFLHLGGGSGKVWEGARECTWKNDPYLQSNKVTVTDRGVLESCSYEVFSLTREGGSKKVSGVHIKCLKQAAHTDGGAHSTATTLLQRAKEWKWQLTDIFSVGCCGCSTKDKSRKNLMGFVLLANEFEAYLNQGKMDERGVHYSPEVYRADRKWISDLQSIRITQPITQSGPDGGKFENIPIKEVPRIESGPVVVKSEERADELRGVSYSTGIEMEAIGFITALKLFEEQGNQSIPKFVSVKGVSDYGSNKSSEAKTTFFGQETESLPDDERQQVATLHSIALVIRGVVERYLVPRKVVNPEQLL